MNLVASAPLWLLVLLLIASAAAAVEDAIRLRISNVTCAAIALGALVAMAIAGPGVALWQNFALFAAVMVVGTAAFSAGVLGGGDVKLMAAIALWLNLRGGLVFLGSVFLAGGLVAILYVTVRIARRAPLQSRKSRRIPYGVAIALATVFTAALAHEAPGPRYTSSTVLPR